MYAGMRRMSENIILCERFTPPHLHTALPSDKWKREMALPWHFLQRLAHSVMSSPRATLSFESAWTAFPQSAHSSSVLMLKSRGLCCTFDIRRSELGRSMRRQVHWPMLIHWLCCSARLTLDCTAIRRHWHCSETTEASSRRQERHSWWTSALWRQRGFVHV